MINVLEHSNTKTRLIEFNFNANQPDKALTDYVEALDIFPIVMISKIDSSGTTIDPKSIFTIELSNNKFLPEIEMYCSDTIGTLMGDFFPLDYDVILSIFVKAQSEETMPIRMDFRVTEYDPMSMRVGSTEKDFVIRGVLDIEELHTTKFEAFTDTSYNVLKNLSSKLNLGFATNTTNTDDNMTWINPADTYLKFIQDITKRSYISDTSFIWTFIDFYYNLNFVDIEKELSESPTDLQSLNSTPTDSTKEERWVEMYLSTSENLSSTNKYISTYNLNNQSFKVNLESGYNQSTKWFDKLDNTIEQVITQENETNDINLTQLRTTKPIADNNWNDTFSGKIDEDNVHKNYHLALTLNQFNISKLHKVTLVATLKIMNFEVKRFQKILVDFIDTNLLNDNTANVNEKLSGYWFVTGINYNFTKDGGSTQEITMIRRDLNIKYTDLHDIRKILKK
jgi:hypothetical protein